jgi:hypothetical protein
MKRLMMTAAALALTATAAIAKELPDCDSDKVLATLQRVTSATTVVEAKNIRSTDPENLRYCKAEVLTANGRLVEFVYELTWTSESEGRFWLQTKGGRVL